ncbi:MAG TPA: GNAT family N-acetyltransferase [Deltaproteobacteria bacterium]|nr:GNAT family N-acetyltransferase [Deltaproteobacteria bacterium]
MPKTTGSPLRPFSEREFYLAEFRRRSIGIAWPETESFDPAAREALIEVVSELAENQSRVVVMSPDEAVFAAVGPSAVVDFGDDRFGPGLWRKLREGGRAGLRLSSPSFAEECTRAAMALRLAKVVWIQSEPPVERPAAEARVSVLDLAHLETLVGSSTGREGASFVVRPGKRELLASIRSMIQGGIPSVNVCAGHEVARELFTYAGAGILFTRDRYAEVRPLALDDYDPANDLIERGEADGFLVPRDPESRDDVLAHGVGVFIEGRYLAGIGAILPHPEENAGEIASLFALTRYAGEGVGSQIVRHAMERARREGLAYLFSCTTSDRVEQFFLRHGFRRVSPDDVPKAKWQAYDPERRARVRCLRFDP